MQSAWLSGLRNFCRQVVSSGDSPLHCDTVILINDCWESCRDAQPWLQSRNWACTQKRGIRVSNEILLRFLSAGLIDVGGDDAKLEKLRETATDLAAKLKKTPTKAIAFSLIAFDPSAPSNEPVIKEAVDALQNRWATYVNTFAGTPVSVIRAILLDALVQAAKEEDRVGVALVTSARNTLPFTKAGNEQAIWVDVVSEIEQRVDARAEAEWATPSSITIPPMTFEELAPLDIALTFGTLNKETLSKSIQAAGGPQSVAGATNGNPHWQANNPAHWTTEFGNRLADTIISSFAAVGKSATTNTIDLSATMESFSADISKYIDSTLHAVSTATAGLQRRTNLIWWKESLFSPTLRISYRQLPCSSAAALMAFDLHQQTPTFSPASVAAFLHEAVLTLPALDATGEFELFSLVKEVQHSDTLESYREAIAELCSTPTARGPVLALIGHPKIASSIDESKFQELVGVSARIRLTIPQWATWLFRELQALRATQEGVEVKRRGRKS